MSGLPMLLGLAWFAGAVAVALGLRPRPIARSLTRSGVSRRSAFVSGAYMLGTLSSLRAGRRARRVTLASARESADVIDLFALAVGSGLNLRLALAAVASRAPPTWTDPLATTVTRIDRGIGVADALDELPALVGEHAHPLVSVLVSSERYGTMLLPALERLATEARFDRRRRAEEAARRVPVKLLFPLVLCILPAFGALTVAPLIAGALGSLRLS
jgi:tight adherence protein C